jgi:N-acetylneuraminic acid mutarotase
VDTILRYDPAADTIETLAVRLPQPTFLAAAAWDGTDAYVFGGFAGTALTDAIVRFDPAVPAVTTMTARLPEALARTAVAEDAGHLYVMGGNTGGFTPTGFVDTITIYDPVGDTVSADVAIPSPRASRIGAIRCNGGIYFLGGWGPSGKLDQILQYRPGVDITALPARLPEALDGGAFACDGTRIYLFGGETATAIVDDIVVFDTTDDSIATAPVTLPTPRKGHAAVWIGGAAYVFGGQLASGLTAEILRITPP